MAQRRFWLLDQLQPNGNPALNMSVALRWLGQLDPVLLREALNQVVQRHEVLRTTFASDRGALQQLVAPTLSVSLQTSDAAEFPENAPEDLVQDLIKEEAQRPFDLRGGPLLRARLVRLEPSEHLLLLSVHHIISDGWSNGVLTRELCAFYTASVAGRTLELPALAIQFADYAEWQQTRLTNGDFAAQLDFWRVKLAGKVPELELPYDRPRRISGEITGAVRSVLVPATVAAAAKSLATQENASPFMLCFAIFQALLHRYTAQVDFLVTTPSANRDRREFESVAGLFVNPLLIRANLRGNPSFRELLGRVRAAALEAFSQQEIPFESILDEVQAARLQVNFHYDSGLQQSLDLPPGVTVEPLPAVSTGTVYELSASVLEDAGGLRLEFEYNTALFDTTTIERMQGHYEMLLRSAVADPAKRISELTLLTPGEERSRVAELRDAADEVDLRARLVERVLAKPDAMLARHGRRELSCAELLARLEAPRLDDHEDKPSDLDRIAARIANWRVRLDGEAPVRVGAALTRASLAMFQRAEFRENERVASSSAPGFAATEEIGAAVLGNAILVYPTPEVLTGSATALLSWLEAENITAAFFSAATWNRIQNTIASRKGRSQTRLRVVIVTEGGPAEGSFGRVHAVRRADPTERTEVCRRNVLAAAGGTIALDGEPLLPQSERLQVLDLCFGKPLPVGLVGELAIEEENGRRLRTGELTRRLPNESFDRLGSIAEDRHVRGIRVDVRLAETALCTLPGVRHALVRYADEAADAQLVAYILPDPAGGAPPQPGALRIALREQRLADLPMPDTFVLMRDIPMRAEDGHLDFAALDALRESSPSDAEEPVRPYLGLQLQLIAIWEDVLGARGIGIRDDFFDLGGNSLLAMRMLQRAEVACGKTIQPSTLFRHPTIERFAGEIAREARDESPALLRVHDAGTRTPFFYLHGDLSGGGFYSLRLSRALGPQQPFYALPPQDIRTLSSAPSIEGMAAAHLEALRTVRPHGPYVVGGFCIGGLVAYELAQQIRASGEKVEMLLIIDAAPDRMLRALQWMADAVGSVCKWDGEAKLAHFGRWTVWHARIALRLQARREQKRGRPPRALRRRLQETFNFVQRRLTPRTSAPPAFAVETSAEEERDLPSAFRWASAAYRPRPYEGPVALLLSEDVLSRAENVSRAWQQLAPCVSLHPLRGSHLECITEHVEALAEKIEDCLQAAASDSSAAESARR